MTEKVRILIIDDDTDMLETLGDILQEKGYVTETAKTGKEALIKAENLFFNVALVDMKLPDMIGTEVLRNLRKKYPSMITIVMTGHATLQNAIEALNLGVNAFIMKPIDAEKVDAMIKKLVKSFEMPASLRKPQIMSILKAIKEGRVTKFIPSFSYERGIFYPDLEKIVPNSSIDYSVLEEIEKYGILRREFYDSGLACPSCASLKVSIKFRCTSCKSTDIDKGAAIEHLRCGHIDKYEGFDKGEKMICPKCSRELKALGVDYRKPGIFFKCGTCGNIMPIPAYDYICGGCGESFTEGQLDIKKFFTFVVETKDKTLVDAWVANFDELLI
jgi:ActR/RegA family two-component response regulator